MAHSDWTEEEETEYFREVIQEKNITTGVESEQLLQKAKCKAATGPIRNS